MHGTGVLDMGTSKYEGEFKEGEIEGKGHKTWKQGEYWGNFRMGHMDGQGRMKTEEGLYEGQFVLNTKHGVGKMIFSNGAVYVGEFVENRITGKGVMQNGSLEYDGEWVNGKKSGSGKFKNEFCTFEGTFVNDSFGNGTLRHVNSSYEYCGLFEYGIPACLPKQFYFSSIAISPEMEAELNAKWLSLIEGKKANEKLLHLNSIGSNAPVILNLPASVDEKKKELKKDATKLKESKKSDDEKNLKALPGISVIAGEMIPTFFVCCTRNLDAISTIQNGIDSDEKTDHMPIGLVTNESGRNICCKLIIPADVFGDTSTVPQDDLPVVYVCSCPEGKSKCDYQNQECKSNALSSFEITSRTQQGVAAFSNLCLGIFCPGDITLQLEFTDTTPQVDGTFQQLPKFILPLTILEGEHSLPKPGKVKDKKKK